MKRLLLLNCCLFAVLATIAQISVRNIDELNNANKSAKPGDVIMLENGEWKNVSIVLDCKGTKDQPIHFKARTTGKVYITGHSKLKLGGEFITVEGLLFERGYAGDDAVITFRVNKDKLANHCRVTNCAINDFNNPRRMDENNWISFYGKNNRLDHCSFVNKKNMGVLLAVHLDDERSRENFHSIDHNYFGLRIPLASNGGEIIRVGVSQHCQFNSNTIIASNHFEQCDGETEIISIKSGSNVIGNNIFRECQGSVVLRHGDDNTVSNNVFLGNNKEGTGGVRIINKGQWVVDNLFYQCRGTGFRSPLAIMNGVPNSPAHRYVQVTDAVIANNTFYECAPASLCEGSDKERSLPPANVWMTNNVFSNNRDSIIYTAYDDIGGFRFMGNKINGTFTQNFPDGFENSIFKTERSGHLTIPRTKASEKLPDSLKRSGLMRYQILHETPGITITQLSYRFNYQTDSVGATWYNKPDNKTPKFPATVRCATASDVYRALEKKEPVVIKLTANKYVLDKPFFIEKQVVFTSGHSKHVITINTGKMLSFFIIGGNGSLKLQNLSINGEGIQATHFISSDTAGSSNHYNLIVTGSHFRNIGSDIFFAYKSMVADSIIFRNNTFTDNRGNFIAMNQERDDKGYYNAEKIILDKNTFTSHTGALLDIYRGGNDESTMGPNLVVKNNSFNNCNTLTDQPLIQLTGVQKSRFLSNTFSGCGNGKKLLVYKDIVRADHLLGENTITNSGQIQANSFVKQFQKTE